ncbi:hypothetical protein EON65_23235 [archaeon]|nr:MAG: hypothetical protein EON65_23235 [archaeon]
MLTSFVVIFDSEEAQFKLKGDLSIISACIYRLVRCLLNNHCSSTCVNGAGEPAVHKLSNFPYNESNANLFQDLCKLLYILDVYPALETASYAQHNSVYVLPSEQLVGYLVEEYTLYKHLFKDVDVQSIDEISVRISRSGNSLDNSISFTHNGSGSHKWNLTWNPLAGLPALELLNAIILIVLTVSPIYLQLLYNCESDINQNNYYIGKLSECEEASLQLLLLASDSTLQSFFGCNSDSSGKQSNKQVAYTTVLMNIQSLHLRHKYLANSLVRVLNRILLGLHSMNTTEKCAVLTPILVCIL